jgi:hypothetical protein
MRGFQGVACGSPDTACGLRLCCFHIDASAWVSTRSPSYGISRTVSRRRRRHLQSPDRRHRPALSTSSLAPRSPSMPTSQHRLTFLRMPGRCLAVLNIGKLGIRGATTTWTRSRRGSRTTTRARARLEATGLGAAAGTWGCRGASTCRLPRRARGGRARRRHAADRRERSLTVAGLRRDLPRVEVSVRLLYGLSDASIVGHVWEAHDAPVAAIVGYLEEAAGRTRLGLNGRRVAGGVGCW